MLNKKLELINFTEKAIALSRECLYYSIEDNIEKVVESIDNRDRIINIIYSLYDDVSSQLDSEKETDEEFLTTFHLLIEKVRELDDELLLYLENEKERVQIEIARTYKNRNNLKGYNLNNTR